ncbi:MAG: UDP-N-acetylglucosamine 2-epimerase (non-hydrolyzing) [Candidatus Zixiibacteriota bacterium]
MKIVSVVGARPQFIKVAMISRELAGDPDITHIVVHTGQHFDNNMYSVFFEELEIPQPDYDLQIHSLSHGAMTGQMIEGLERLLKDESPDIVLVYGDTNSTLAGALAARKLHLKVAHVEAGLRSFNLDMPEEVNRVITDRISDILFCPTDAAVENLRSEGFEKLKCRIINTGDVMYDASVHYSKLAPAKSKIISRLGLDNFVLCTIHRAENTDNLSRFMGIINGLNSIAEAATVILPLHPRTRQVLSTQKITTRLKTIDPVGFFDMIELLKHCKLVITDSGGVQKEAYFYKKACLTLRDETEWVELAKRGYNRVVGSDSELIRRAFDDLIRSSLNFEDGLYGDGRASHYIIKELKNEFANRQSSR